MLRRTTILALAVGGALAAGLVVTGHSGVDRINLAGSQGHISTVKLGQLGTVKSGQFSGAKTTSVTPIKPGTITAKPVTGTPAKPSQVTPATVGQFKTIQLKELSATKALQARVSTAVVKGTIHAISFTSHTPEGKCAISGGRGLFDHPYDVDVTGKAWYRTVPNSPGFYEWFQFQYKLDGLVAAGGSHNNASIRMYEAGTPKFENTSPDDRRLGQWYYVVPTSPVYTRTTSSVNLDFQGTFDRSLRSDPSCTARTGRL